MSRGAPQAADFQDGRCLQQIRKFDIQLKNIYYRLPPPVLRRSLSNPRQDFRLGRELSNSSRKKHGGRKEHGGSKSPAERATFTKSK